ncbi:phosphodiester glycosidase family protein, partial [Candidatus Amoebophilus asiaticus]|nr:phosphodiester glycosidase family protein [Candidatus Amoebophilus asiaticus]
NYIANSDDNELRLLHKYKLCKVIATEQWCAGIHFYQLGDVALKILKRIRSDNGFIIANGDNPSMMTDIVDIDRFHIGKAEKELTAKVMGIPRHSGFIEFVPAGVRATLSYPTPVQTAFDFYKALKGPLFRKLSNKLGEKKLFEIIHQDVQKSGTPINVLLKKIELRNKPTQKKMTDLVDYNFVRGIYQDGLPWSGVTVQINMNTNTKWNFAAYTSTSKTRPVTEFVKEYKRKFKKDAKIAWNGGYILNPELVGKLGLPESYIGSPLGLLIANKKVVCPPLFNKPAFVVYPNGKLDIKLVNSKNGMLISDSSRAIEFKSENYNKHVHDQPCFYDLLYESPSIPGNGHVLIRLAGTVIKEVIFTRRNDKIKSIPVGLTLSIPAHLFPSDWDQKNKKLSISMIGWEDIEHAIEAGPLLVYEGKNCIDMEKEGWKHRNSINTQAARLDFTDMRGPKIAVGLDKKGNLTVLTINGRIRESVGATHIDMADILLDFGLYKAMGFDPGGSSTVVVDGRALNISPYNHEYEKDIYSLPPEPRAVANAVIGWVG